MLNDSLETHRFIKTPEGVEKKGIKTGKRCPCNLSHLYHNFWKIRGNSCFLMLEDINVKFVFFVFFDVDGQCKQWMKWMKHSSLAMLVGLNDKNVFIFFCSRLQAFYQASRFRPFACKIFLFFLSFLLALARFFFFLFLTRARPCWYFVANWSVVTTLCCRSIKKPWVKHSSWRTSGWT